jgi:DNA-binding transcriptional LysR family regulator
MKNITIRQMRIFESVSRHLSYSRAAEDLHLTQPAVSMQIRQMEDQAGLPLFLHIGKRISLTETGKLILHHCRVILADMRAAEQSLSALVDGSMQHLRIGLITSASYFFPRLINAFVQARGGIELNMTVRNREQLIGLLRDETIDVAVMVQSPEDYILNAESFAPNPFVLVASPTHPLTGETDIPLSRIVSERLIVRENGTDTRNVADEIFCGKEVMPRLMELGCEEAIKQSVMAEMGISFLSAQAVHSEVRAGLLTILDVQGFPVERQWRFVCRADRPLPIAARDFRTFLLSEARGRLADLMGIDSVQTGIHLRQPIHTPQETLTTRVVSPNAEMARRTRALLKTESLPNEHRVQGQNHTGCDDRRAGDLAGSSKLSHH